MLDNRSSFPLLSRNREISQSSDIPIPQRQERNDENMADTFYVPLRSQRVTALLWCYISCIGIIPVEKTRKCRDIFGKLPFQLSLKFSLCFPTQQLSNLSFFQFKSQSESVIRISDTANCARCRVNTRYHPCDGFQYGVNFPHCFQFHTHVNLSFIISGNEVVMCIILKW